MKLPQLTGKELAKAIEAFGFELVHIRGVIISINNDGRKTVIPVHTGQEIGPGLLNKIIKRDLQITREEFLNKLHL